MTPANLSTMTYDLLHDHRLCVDGEFTETSDLQSSGLDSLALTQLRVELQRNAGHWLDESLLDEDSLRSCQTLGTCMSEFIIERENAPKL
jgi:aryl carrier-like protein